MQNPRYVLMIGGLLCGTVGTTTTLGFSGDDFIDLNVNGVDDALEIADPSIPPSANAIRWEVADGGNGHWYELVQVDTTIPDAIVEAAARGGYLATFTEPGENVFVATNYQGLDDSASVGGIQRQPGIEPLGSWCWATNEPWTGVDWRKGEPNDTAYFGGAEGRMEMYLKKPQVGQFNDVSGNTPRWYLIEWDAAADCNGNGLIDTCELSLGLDEDRNGNRIPDSCEAIVVPGDFASIQDAIDAAPEEGVVLVEPGTYNETLLFPADGRNVVLASTDGPASTIIDATDLSASVIEISGGQTDRTSVRGFTITGGLTGSASIPGQASTYGGGLLVFGADPYVADCDFLGNRATFGGNAYLINTSSEIRNCVFDGGFAESDGGNLMLFRAESLVATCSMTGARAVNDGGGLKVVLGAVSMIDCLIDDNLATTGGGAMYFELDDEPSSFDFLRCTVINNSAKFGGGFWTRPSGDGPVLAETVVCDNTPDNFFGAYQDLGNNELCVCLGDLNGDRRVDGVDLGVWLALAGTECPRNNYCPADLNQDGLINGGDLGILLSHWGFCD